MKKLNILFAVITGLVLFSCKSAPTKEEAIKYNDFIMGYTDAIDKSHDELKDAWVAYNVDTFDVASLDGFKAILESVKKNVEIGLLSVKANNDNGDNPDFSGFKDIAEGYFNSVKSLCDNDWAEIVTLISKGDELTSEDLDKCNAIVDSLYEKKNVADDKFIKFQKEFANKFEFELEDTQSRDDAYKNLGIDNKN
jgi:hypothetical protein